VHETRYCEAGGTDGDELGVFVREERMGLGEEGREKERLVGSGEWEYLTMPGRAVSRGSFWVMRR